MNVFLIGFMGSGKTSNGKMLARHLGLNFVDLDTVIEMEQQSKIAEIFRVKGEDYFRDLEHIWLQNFSDSNALISVGGGTPCFNNNINLMHEKGVLVYLKLSVEMLADRLLNSNADRPIIAPYKHDKEALLKFMSDLLLQRERFYNKADLIFEASNLTATKKNLLIEMINKCIQKKEALLQ